MNTHPLVLLAAVAIAVASSSTSHAAIDILHSFTGAVDDGAYPHQSLTVSGSTLYGVTPSGGSAGEGTIFKMNTDGTGFALLRSFAGGAGDGKNPYNAMTLSGSILYGVTHFGGTSTLGTIFRMNTDGTGFSLLHSFAGGASDGDRPFSALTLSGSKLYGTTAYGGSASSGTVFSINADGTDFSLLYSFAGGPGDGAFPQSALTLSGSSLYGMTNQGGASNAGTIFSLGTDGTGYEVIHEFGAGSGAYPEGGLTLSGSKLYGLSASSVFSIDTDGTDFTVLHSFPNGPNDGFEARGPLTLVGTTLYGMTALGGADNRGTLFSIETNGSGFAILENFGLSPDANIPLAGGLVLSENGSTLFGATNSGGTSGLGTIFSREIEAVPEPATVAFGLAAFAGLILRRRRVLLIRAVS